MKKPRKSRHRIPSAHIGFKSAEDIDPAYQAEVDRSVAALEKRYAAARRRLENAKEKANQPEVARSPKRLKISWREIEAAERELREIEQLMQPGNRPNRYQRGRESRIHIS